MLQKQTRDYLFVPRVLRYLRIRSSGSPIQLKLYVVSLSVAYQFERRNVFVYKRAVCQRERDHSRVVVGFVTRATTLLESSRT